MAERLLRPDGINPPNVRGDIERVYQYCLDSEWGNRPVTGKG